MFQGSPLLQVLGGASNSNLGLGIGAQAATGTNNTAIGFNALSTNSGGSNIALGSGAGNPISGQAATALALSSASRLVPAPTSLRGLPG